jgi:hypothetical protein
MRERNSSPAAAAAETLNAEKPRCGRRRVQRDWLGPMLRERVRCLEDLYAADVCRPSVEMASAGPAAIMKHSNDPNPTTIQPFDC